RMAARGGAVHVATTKKVYKGKTYVTHLLRRSLRQGKTITHETLGNLSHLPDHVIELIKRSLRAETFVSAAEAWAEVTAMTDQTTPLESAVTVPAYFVALVEIHDPAGFQSYHEQFEATLAPFGGRLVSFGATIDPLEGMDGSTARAAIVVFPSLQAGRDWFESPAYQRIAPLRQQSAGTQGFFVEGLPVW